MLTVLLAVCVVVGLLGIVLPVLPGLLIVWGSVALWGVVTHHWWLVGIVTAAYAAGLALQYVLPGRRMRAGGVPTRTLVLGVLLAIPGFFVVPVVGAVAGFVLGVYLSELQRVRGHSGAWSSTVVALRAVGLSMMIELVTGLAVAGAWAVALWWGR